jgi:two-component system osmolarity sensor histidine kinase EnvZ
MSAAIDFLPPRNQQPVTELLTSALGDLDEEPGDSIFEEEGDTRKRPRISLFWYTFGLLLLLLGVSALAGYWLSRSLDEEPRIRESARQIVSIAALTRMALLYPNMEHPLPPVETLMPEKRMHLVQRMENDRIQPFPDSDQIRFLVAALRQQLGPDASVARTVNNRAGLWIGFTVGRDEKWWLWFDNARLEQGISGGVWLLWAVTMALPLLIGTALFSRLVNRPLDALANAAMRVRDGNYADNRLNEAVSQAEVHEVNVRFNRMTEQLARVEQERAQMLAGISHDLRTPLARLRLEIEMGVSDAETRVRMASDIDQVGAILNKFLDYARPSRIELCAVDLYKLARRCARPFVEREDMSVQIDVPKRVHVMADQVELGRVIYNLLENASRYGQTPGTGFTKVRIAATAKDGWLKLRVRDYGTGVPEEQLGLLTRPFYRGDAARQNAAGTGLGLSIAVRMIEAMGGQFRIRNASSGGLQALIRLQLADGLSSARTNSGDSPSRRR